VRRRARSEAQSWVLVAERVLCEETQSAQQTGLHQHGPRNRTRRKREQAGGDGGKTQCPPEQRQRGADDEDVQMRKRERQLRNYLAAQHLLLHSTITGGDGGSGSGVVVGGAVGDGDGTGDTEGAMGFFLPEPFAVDWRLFAACAWRERQTNRTNRGRDRNWDAVH
jgi:hypothetical protein